MISSSFRQRTLNQSSAAAYIELNCKFKLTKLVMVLKFKLTFGYKLKYNLGINPAVSQNLRRPFRQNLPGAKTAVNPTSHTPPASRNSQRGGV